MTTAVGRRRGTAADNNRFTGIEGEITVDLTNAELRVHTGDGTVGGYGTARKDLANVDQSSIANRGIAKSDLTNVTDDTVLAKTNSAIASDGGAGVAYRNLTNIHLSTLGDFTGTDDVEGNPGGVAYKDLSNVTGTAFFNNLGIAKRDMSNVTDQVILNKAVARATTLGGTGLAYKNLNNTKLSNYGNFLGTDDSGTAAGGLAYKDMSNVTGINKLAELGLARADLTNVDGSVALNKVASGAATAGGGGVAYKNLSNILITAFDDFQGTDDSGVSAGGLAYKNLANTKLSDYGTFKGTDDTSTSAAGLAYKDLSNVTGTAFFNNLGIAKRDLSNVTDADVLSKAEARATALGGTGLAYKNFKNTKLSDFNIFQGTDDSGTSAGGLAYKDVSNTKLSSFGNFAGTDDSSTSAGGLAYKDLSNTNINTYLGSYALKDGSDININNLASRGLAKADLSNVDRNEINKIHLNFLLNSTCAANYTQYVSGEQVPYNNEAYDKWFAINEGNNSITSYTMQSNTSDQEFTFTGSFVQPLSCAKFWFKNKKVYVWCKTFTQTSNDFSCNFIDNKDYSRKYFTNNKTLTYDSTRGIYYAEFNFNDSSATALMPTSDDDVGFFISSKDGTTLGQLQIELDEITAYERKNAEQERSECLPGSNKMDTVITLVKVTAVEPTGIYNEGDQYYNSTDNLIYRYNYDNNWVVESGPHYDTLYIDRSTGGTWVRLNENGLVSTQTSTIIREWSD